MAKIVLIGAGSHVFSRNTISDVISYPELRDSTISLMDIDKERLDLITAFANKLVEHYGFKTQIESTTDRREALEGADYVIDAIRVGGSLPTQADREITVKYGVNEAIGDTIGPSGVFYGLRNIPVILDICHDMEELCPDAWLINYSNPMAMTCWAINDYTHIRNVGLCHSVQGTSRELARYIGVPLAEISYWVAGINHMAWFLELKWHGEDAYPLLREKFKDPEIYSRSDAHWAGADNVRVEIFKAFGYFNTESSRHMSEYVPYFRKRPELFERFKIPNLLDFETAAKRKLEQDEELKQLLSTDHKLLICRTDD